MEDKDLEKGAMMMPTIKLIDFGTAKLTIEKEGGSKQKIKDPKGTWIYMAPEV